MNRRRFILATVGASAAAMPGISSLGAMKRRGGEDESEFYCGLTLQEHREELAGRLYDEYLPFWNKGGYDKEHGGFICNLTPEGIPVDDEKFIWYQGRAIWVYSFLYNHFGRDPGYLEIARKTRDFMVRYMYLGDGKWAELVRRDGKLIKGVGPGSDVYGWLFAANGLAEYYRISGDKEDIKLAEESILAAVKAYDSPVYQQGTEQEGFRQQGHSMVLARLLTQLIDHHSDPVLEDLLDFHADRLMTAFYNPQYRISNERLHHDYSRIPGEEGWMFLGHSLEAQWMVMQYALQKQDQAIYSKARDNFRRYLEIGWDPIFDGWASEDYHVFAGEDHALGTDYATKTMWAHTEILIGCMMVIENSGDTWARDWYRRTWEYVKKTYCLGAGAWEQAVNRQGEPISREKWGIHPMRRGNYHQPRFLMVNILSLDRMLERTTDSGI
jgi:mannose/cellobiose epimerase-like protein (N-acyl-D-glucosamine 2-epimerase family)